MTTLTNEIFEANKSIAPFIRDVAHSHGCADQHGTHKHYKAFGIYPDFYTFKDTSFIDKAKVIYEQMKTDKLKSIEKSNKIHFVQMGGSIKTNDSDDIPTYRMRAEFYNINGNQYFVEVSRMGGVINVGNIHFDFSIDRTKQIRDGNNSQVGYNYAGLERNYNYAYKLSVLLNVINSVFKCKYTGIEVEKYFVSTDDFINDFKH